MISSLSLNCLLEQLVEDVLVLDEAAKTIGALESEDLALSIMKGGTYFVLYDPLLIDQEDQIEDNYDYIHGFIQIKHSSTCNSWIVSYVSAKKNYGPTMYDIAMSYIYPDFMRADTRYISTAARKIWNFMYTHRANEFLMEPISDLSTSLSCKAAEEDESKNQVRHKSIDYAYAIKNWINLSVLTANHSKFVKTSKLVKRDFEYKLRVGSSKMFNDSFEW